MRTMKNTLYLMGVMFCLLALSVRPSGSRGGAWRASRPGVSARYGEGIAITGALLNSSSAPEAHAF